jgi:hypothetical protein
LHDIVRVETVAAVAKFAFSQKVTLPGTGRGDQPGCCCPTVVGNIGVSVQFCGKLLESRPGGCALKTSPITKFQIIVFAYWPKEINKSGKTKLSNNVAGVADAIYLYHKMLAKLVCYIEEHRLSVFVNGVLRNISGPEKDEVTGVIGDGIICIVCQILFGLSNQAK